MAQPTKLSRREVLSTASVLGLTAAGIGVSSSCAAGPEETLFSKSGLITGKPKILKYDELPGLLTKSQILPHYTAHYGGALKRFSAIESMTEKRFQGGEKAGGDAHGFVQRDRVNKMNSVLLHELYFDGLTPNKNSPEGSVQDAIKKRFGTLDRWMDDFRSCCVAANGWGILARDAVNGRLYNVISDLHENGVLWLGQPLLVCDVYEHAFYVDYQNRKKDYVDKFTDFLDWQELNRRWQILSR